MCGLACFLTLTMHVIDPSFFYKFSIFYYNRTYLLIVCTYMHAWSETGAGEIAKLLYFARFLLQSTKKLQ